LRIEISRSCRNSTGFHQLIIPRNIKGCSRKQRRPLISSPLTKMLCRAIRESRIGRGEVKNLLRKKQGVGKKHKKVDAQGRGVNSDLSRTKVVSVPIRSLKKRASVNRERWTHPFEKGNAGGRLEYLIREKRNSLRLLRISRKT